MLPAQNWKKESDRITKLYRQMYSLILTVCHDTNRFRVDRYYHGLEPAPHHMDRPDSEEYKFEANLLDEQLTTQSEKLVKRWEEMMELANSSEEAKLALHTIWKREVSTYEDRHGLQLFRFKSCYLP